MRLRRRATQSDYRFGVRLDHNISNTQRINFRVGTFNGDQSSTPTMDTPLYTSSISQVKGGKTGNLNYSWTTGPTMLVDLRASATYTPQLNGARHPDGFKQ